MEDRRSKQRNRFAILNPRSSILDLQFASAPRYREYRLVHRVEQYVEIGVADAERWH
jgi:hypothetical protein